MQSKSRPTLLLIAFNRTYRILNSGQADRAEDDKSDVKGSLGQASCNNYAVDVIRYSPSNRASWRGRQPHCCQPLGLGCARLKCLSCLNSNCFSKRGPGQRRFSCFSIRGVDLLPGVDLLTRGVGDFLRGVNLLPRCTLGLWCRGSTRDRGRRFTPPG